MSYSIESSSQYHLWQSSGKADLFLKINQTMQSQPKYKVAWWVHWCKISSKQKTKQTQIKISIHIGFWQDYYWQWFNKTLVRVLERKFEYWSWCVLVASIMVQTKEVDLRVKLVQTCNNVRDKLLIETLHSMTLCHVQGKGWHPNIGEWPQNNTVQYWISTRYSDG